MLDSVFVREDLVGAAMQAAVVRNDVINNNIANADTPGFKKRVVKFETYLRSLLNDMKNGKQDKTNIDFSAIVPTIHLEHTGFNYRIDENNVDIETEMVDLYENSVRYDVLANSVMADYKRINVVINGIK